MFEFAIPRLTVLYTFKKMRGITKAKADKVVEDLMKTKRL